MWTAWQRNLYYRWRAQYWWFLPIRYDIIIHDRGPPVFFVRYFWNNFFYRYFFPFSSSIIIFFFSPKFYFFFLVPDGVTAKLPFKTIVRFKNIVNLFAEKNTCSSGCFHAKYRRTREEASEKKIENFLLDFFLMRFFMPACVRSGNIRREEFLFVCFIILF